MTYDQWKTRSPDDEFLAPDPPEDDEVTELEQAYERICRLEKALMAPKPPEDDDPTELDVANEYINVLEDTLKQIRLLIDNVLGDESDKGGDNDDPDGLPF
jgi:hypothetical protein